MSFIVDNHSKILEEIIEFKKKKNINLKTKIIAVSKTFKADAILPLLRAGHKEFGENKVQEAHLKWAKLKQDFNNINLHLIGPLQSNKVKQALDIFDCIQTLDREKIVLKIKNYINMRGNELKTNHQFMVQVNVDNESQKSGLNINDVTEFVKWCKFDIKINIVGLMCIPDFNKDPSGAFKTLSKLADNCSLKEKSMGMSKDYLSAIEFGSSYIRLGTKIFGERVKQQLI
ncbi:MAG: YggS family pyridoxal phosphate-dependent enzyme [Rickettsiales bacterium]|nr:YggS family pyridoxal phosphate-dependent enzyme [Rickettsiales bacterium]OUV54805.1 MAG: YggS family pyridoxal phosphate enzyme [Rickettsiales bacterium TMED127]